MLSIDLFDSKYEKKLHEGAVDDLMAHLIEPLSRRAMDIRTQLRSRQLDPAQVSKLEKEYEELVQKRLDIILDRKTQTQEQQIPSKQDPFAYVKPEPKGVGDVQDPRDKMAQLAQKSKKGPLANVGAGLRAFIKGEPEPMDEEQDLGTTTGPRAYGVANFQRLVKANMGNIPTVSLEFIRPEENFKLDQKGLELISDYYDGLENDQAKNYFIYRVLPSGDETRKVLKQIGWNPQQIQPSLPGIPTQGELPLQEKKKSNSNDLEVGDVKVARELQKLRAEYPTARSDLEAVARAEIDSDERNRRQLSAIRGANEKQDALLKQLVDLDQEQGREINTLDKENDSLEQRLAQVQATNDRLQQAIGTMTGTKKAAAKPQKIATQGSADLAQGGIIDVGAPATSAPDTTSTTKSKSTTSPALGSMAQQLGGFSNVIPMRSIRSPQATTDTDIESQPAPSIRQASNDDESQPQKVSGSDIREHGGGIGPRKHWQSMMQEGAVKRALDDYKIATDAEFFDKYKMTKREFYNQVINAGNTEKPYKAPQACPQCGKAHESCVCESASMYETALNPNNPKDDYEAKRRALHDLSLNKSVDQAAVLQRRLDLDREAKAKGITETVVDVKAGMAQIYHRLAPKIERHRDSFLAGQLYDELENYAELHGAEREFKQMMNGARNRAHMEYDTNPGGFHNWFWFLPFADEQVEEGFEYASKVQHPKYGSGQVVKVYSNGMITVNFPNFPDPIDKKPGVQTNFMPGDAGYNSLKSGMTESTDDVKKRMSKLEALALAANRAGDDAKCKMYQQKIQSLKQKLSQSMAESSKPGEYYVHTVYFKDGTKKRIRVTSDEVDVADYYTKRGKAVDRVDYDFQLHSDMTEAEKEPTTRQELLNRLDKIQRMMTQDRNPANLQILRKKLEMLKQRYQHLKEDSDGSEAVEMAIMRRMLVAHTDLIIEFGLDKVVNAIEEVAYNVGDTDEIGSSDVSGWVRQVKQILGVDA